MKGVATTPVSRRKRYHRTSDRALALTERDIDIIAYVARHRFLRSDHVAALVGGSQQRILRRLRLLFDHGYLDRPTAQLTYQHMEGNRPMAYGLGNCGADALKSERGLPYDTINWTWKNKKVRAPFLEHTLAVADCMVPFEVSTRDHDHLRLISDEELIRAAPEQTQRRRNPYKWSVEAKLGESGKRQYLSLVPDAMFGFHFLSGERQGQACFFALEADRGTMPVMRKSLKQTSFYRKLLTYYHAWKQKRHTHAYGWKAFRVLTVTNSPERVETMLEAVNDMTDGRGSNLFYFTDFATLAANGALRTIWRTTKRKQRLLV
jgi:DNA-binding Lrp family transcriptional regulator